MPDRVTIGCSTWRDYDFLLPLACMLWRERIGYEPLVVLVADEAYWRGIPRSSIVLDALREHEFDVHFVGHLKGPFEHATIAQNARQHVGALDLPDDVFLVTSDADLWPLDAAWFCQVNRAKRMTLWYANAYEYQNHCMCSMGATVGTWRSIMGVNAGEGISVALERTLTAELGDNKDSWKAWNSDEWATSRKIKAMPWYPAQVQMIERRGAPPVDRIDRSCWPVTVNVSGMVDAHMLRPAQWDKNWPRVRPILEQTLPARVQWADDFRNRYNASYASDEPR